MIVIPSGVSEQEVASSVIGYNALTRAGDQSISITSLLYAGAFLVFMYGFGSSIMESFSRSAERSEYRATAQASGGNGFEVERIAEAQTMQAMPAATQQPIFATNTPLVLQIELITSTPVPVTPSAYLPEWTGGNATVTPLPYDVRDIDFVFSYYDPSLIEEDAEKYATNCHPDNYRYRDSGSVYCLDTTASGEKWSSWFMDKAWQEGYKGGVAVPFNPDTCPRNDELIFDVTCVPLYPMYSDLIVESPATIAGVYKVVDICPACGAYIQSHGVLFLDFLAEGMPPDVTWWSPVEVSQVVYP